MSPWLILLVILAYVSLLMLVSFFTGRSTDNATFFRANRSAPWPVVAFGMIGASISGVTFISVPGKVGPDHWSYFQMVLGYLLGYLVIGAVLMPLYYRNNLTSIYTWLERRFGPSSYRTGAVFFLISRLMGSSLRLYLVAIVLQITLFDPLGIPLIVNVLFSLGLIYLYTFRGGIKTVIWTDTLQTAAFLIAGGVVVYLAAGRLGLSGAGLAGEVLGSPFSQVFHGDWRAGSHFLKQFIGGAFIAIAMTGLDQDMMQKNLACRSLGDAQKNMFLFSVTLVFVNLLFLSIGTLLYMYGQEAGLVEWVGQKGCALRIADPLSGELRCYSRTDDLFPILAMNYLGPVAGLAFIIGIIAAAYSSMDSTLTALTTSFCVDLLGFEKQGESVGQLGTRRRVHLGFTAASALIVLIFSWLNNRAVIDVIFDVATYTYGPLLGLFFYGILTRRQVQDRWVPLVCVLAPLLTFGTQYASQAWLGYTFSFEKLPLNGLLTMAGLRLLDAGRMQAQALRP
jgi:Na+/proline symporter